MSNQIVKNDPDSITVQLSVILQREDGHFVAYCPALELSSYGDTEEEAKQGFDEALDIFLEDTHEKGTLEKVLLKLGWALQQKPKPSYKPPQLSLEDQRILKTQKDVYEESVELPV